MKNKSPLFIILGIYALFFGIPFFISIFGALTEAQMNPFDYARITDVDYKAVVMDEPYSEGSVMITERLTFDIHAASRNNTFWELWRDLPEDYIDGVQVDYEVHSVKQILPDGTEIIYEESDRLYWEDEDYLSTNYEYGPGKWYHSPGPYNEDYRDYECVFFYIDDVYREEMVFEVTYEMHNAALKYNDCSDLYLALYSEDTINHLESYHGEILFPNKDMPSPGNYEYTTYGTNAESFPVKESADMNPGYYTFYFDLDKEDLQFRPYNEYIEFDLVSYGEDKHIFTDYAPDNYYSGDDVLEEIREEQKEYRTLPGRFRVKKLILFAFLFTGSFGVLLYARNTHKKMLNKNMYYDVEPLEFYRDIPSDLDPNFAAHLTFCKHKKPKDDGIYSSILLSLARKEYISISESGLTDINITILKQAKPAPIAAPQSVTPTVSNPYATPGYAVSALEQSSSEGDWVNELPPINSEADIANTQNILPESEPVIQEPEYEPLTVCEEYYYNLLVRHAIGNTISMNYLQARVTSDYENTDAFVRNMENSIVNIGIQNGYFQKADYKQPRNIMEGTALTLFIFGLLVMILPNLILCNTRFDFAFGGFFLLGLSMIVGSRYIKKKAAGHVLLTYEGEVEYAKWRGLYNFLNSETLIKERDYVELPLWEKYLVYATAFGLSEKVINAISIRCPDVESSSVLSNDCYRSQRFHHSSGRSFRSSVRSGSSIARSGGYSGGGGFGYGGGGRGGGGGGGGH